MGFFSIKAVFLLSSYYGKSNLRVPYVFWGKKKKQYVLRGAQLV